MTDLRPPSPSISPFLVFCRNPLTVDDLWELEGYNRTDKVYHSTRVEWEKEKQGGGGGEGGKEPSLFRVLVKQAPFLVTFATIFFFFNSTILHSLSFPPSTSSLYLISFILAILGLLPAFLMPALIKWLQYFPETNSTTTTSYGLVGFFDDAYISSLLFYSPFLRSACPPHSSFALSGRSLRSTRRRL